MVRVKRGNVARNRRKKILKSLRKDLKVLTQDYFEQQISKL